MRRLLIAAALVIATAAPALANTPTSPCQAQLAGRPVFSHLPWWKGHGWVYVTNRGQWSTLDGSRTCEVGA